MEVKKLISKALKTTLAMAIVVTNMHIVHETKAAWTNIPEMYVETNENGTVTITAEQINSHLEENISDYTRYSYLSSGKYIHYNSAVSSRYQPLDDKYISVLSGNPTTLSLWGSNTLSQVTVGSFRPTTYNVLSGETEIGNLDVYLYWPVIVKVSNTTEDSNLTNNMQVIIQNAVDNPTINGATGDSGEVVKVIDTFTYDGLSSKNNDETINILVRKIGNYSTTLNGNKLTATTTVNGIEYFTTTMTVNGTSNVAEIAYVDKESKVVVDSNTLSNANIYINGTKYSSENLTTDTTSNTTYIPVYGNSFNVVVEPINYSNGYYIDTVSVANTNSDRKVELSSKPSYPDGYNYGVSYNVNTSQAVEGDVINLSASLAQKTISTNDLATDESYEIEINKNYSSSKVPNEQGDDTPTGRTYIKKLIFEEIVKDTLLNNVPVEINYETDITVVFYQNGISGIGAGWENIETYRLFDAAFNDATEQIKITWNGSGKYPAVTIGGENGFVVKVKDSRSSGTIVADSPIQADVRDIILNDTNYSTDDLKKQAIIDRVLGLSNADYAGIMPNHDIKTWLDSNYSVLKENNGVIEGVITFSFDGNDTHQPATANKEIYVKLTNYVLDSTINVNDADIVEFEKNDKNTETLGHQVDGFGIVTFNVTPLTNKEIESILVTYGENDNVDFAVEGNSITFNQGVATVTFVTGEDIDYSVVVEYTEDNVFDLTDNVIDFNGYTENGSVPTKVLSKAEILSLVYNEQNNDIKFNTNDIELKVENTVVTDSYTFDLIEDREYIVTVTYKGNRYDNVVANTTATITTNDTRTKINGINYADTLIELSDIINDYSLINKLDIELLVNGKKVTLSDSSKLTAVLSGEYPDVNSSGIMGVEITFTGDSEHMPYTTVISNVTVKNTAAPNTFKTIESNATGGTLTITPGVVDNKILGATNTTVIVNAPKGYAVKDVTVTAQKGGEIVTLTGNEKPTVTYNSGVATINFVSGQGYAYTFAVEYVENKVYLNNVTKYEYTAWDDVTGKEVGKVLSMPELFSHIVDLTKGLLANNELAIDDFDLEVRTNISRRFIQLTDVAQYFTLVDGETLTITVKYTGDKYHIEDQEITIQTVDTRKETSIHVSEEEFTQDIRDLMDTNNLPNKEEVIELLTNYFLPTLISGEDELTYTIQNNYAGNSIENNGKDEFTLTYSFVGNADYKSSTKEVNVLLTNNVKNNNVTINETLEGQPFNQTVGTVVFGEGNPLVGNQIEGLKDTTFVVTPVFDGTYGYAIESLTVVASDGKEIKDYSLTFNNGAATVTFESSENIEYTINVNYIPYGIQYNGDLVVEGFDNGVDYSDKEATLIGMVEDALYGNDLDNINNYNSIYFSNVKYEYKSADAGLGFDANYHSLNYKREGWTDRDHEFGKQLLTGNARQTEEIRITYTSKNPGQYPTIVSYKTVQIALASSITVNFDSDLVDIGVTNKDNLTDSQVLVSGQKAYITPGATYNLIVRPKNSADYIESVTGKTWSNEKYDLCIGTYTFSAVEDEDVTVSVTTKTSSLDAKDVTIENTPTNLAGLTSKELFNAIVTVNNSIPNDASLYVLEGDNANVSVEIENGLTAADFDDFNQVKIVNGEAVITKNVTITRKADSRYPKMTATVNVTFIDSRTITEINATAPQGAVNYQGEENFKSYLLEITDATVFAGKKDLGKPEVTYTPITLNGTEGKYFTNVTFSYAGTEDKYRPSSITFENVEVVGVNDIKVTLTNDDLRGNVVLVDSSNNITQAVDGVFTIVGNGEYSILITPVVNGNSYDYAVNSIKVGNTTLPLTYKDSVATATYEFGVVDYTVHVEYEKNAFTYTGDTVVSYDEVDQANIYEEIISNPILSSELETFEIEYLARTADTYKVFVDKITYKGMSFDVNREFEIKLGDLWLKPGEKVDSITLEEAVDLALYDLENGKINIDLSLTDISNALSGDYNAITSKVTGIVEDYLERYTLLAHEYGANGNGSTETLKITYVDEKYNIVEQKDVTIGDNRTVTTLDVNKEINVQYGITAVGLYNAILAGKENVVGNNNIRLDYSIYPNADEYVKTLGVGTHTVKVEYAGNDNYTPATAEITVNVTKAPITATMNSGVYKYGDASIPTKVEDIYSLTGVVNNDLVDTIVLVLGLEAEDGVGPFVGLYIPSNLNSLIEMALGRELSGEITNEELEQIITFLKQLDPSVLEAIGSSEVVNVLDSLIQAIPEDLPEFTVRLNGAIPTDIGAYVTAAITADGNYETAYDIGYYVITPDGMKAELDWYYQDENYMMTYSALNNLNLGTYVTKVYEGNIEAAQKEVMNLIIGIDVNGDFVIERVTNEVLNGNAQSVMNAGAYTQIGYIQDLGNTMYYAKPIVRAYAVVPETVTMEFSDDNVRTFEEGKTHTLDVIGIYDKDGNALDLEEAKKYIKVYYTGVSLNDPLGTILTTEAPTDAGVYAVMAVYNEVRGENPRFGMEISELVIVPAESELDVTSTNVIYGSKEYREYLNNYSPITITPESAKYLTIIAGVDVNGDITGNINFDFPAKLDAILVDVLGDAYTNGISASALKAKMDELANAIADLGFENVDESTQNIVATMNSFLDKAANNTTITFNNDVKPTNIGAYIVAGVTCDPNYLPSADIGYLVITPSTTKAELDWVYDDNNAFVTVQSIQNVEGRLDSYVVKDGLTEDEYNAAVEFHRDLYVGITAKGELIKTSNAKELAQYGAYTQLGYIYPQLANEIVYAEPIIRSFVVVPENVEIQFVESNEDGTIKRDENGLAIENDDRIFTFEEGKQHAFDAVVLANGVEIANTDDGSKYLTVYYSGVSANHPTNKENLLTTTPPTDAGVYMVTAIYAQSTGEGAPRYGLEVGEIAIKPAASEINVDNMTVLAKDANNRNYDILVDVLPNTAKYTTIIAGIDAEGDITGTINVDFPARLDAILKEIVPSAYTAKGIALPKLSDKLAEIEAKLVELGYESKFMDSIQSFLALADGQLFVTFNETDDVKPTDMGVYLVGTVVTDPNYEVSADVAYLAIVPELLEVDLEFDYFDENNLITINYMDSYNFNAHAENVVGGTLTNDQLAAATNQVKDVFIGISTEGLFMKADKPVKAYGAFTQISFIYPELNDEVYYATPIYRPYVVVPETVSITFENDEDVKTVVYNGQPQSMNFTVTHNNGTVLEGGNVRYVGFDARHLEAYDSTIAPTNVGTYAVIATYFNVEENLYGMRLGNLTITPAEAVIDVPDTQVVEFAELEDYEFEIISKAKDFDQDVLYATILTGITLDSELDMNLESDFARVINVDFPAYVDKYLQELLPGGFNNGYNLTDFNLYLNKVKESLEAIDVDTTGITNIQNKVNELAAEIGLDITDVVVTFKATEEVKPTKAGTYMVMGFTCDPNFKFTMDAGVLVITPSAMDAELSWNTEIEKVNGIPMIELEDIEEFDMGVTATLKDGSTIDAEFVDVYYVGLNVDEIVYVSKEKPTTLGTYVQVAVLHVLDSQTYLAAPIARTFTITMNNTDIIFSDEKLVYNGQPQSPTATLVGGTGTDADLIIRYVGYRNGVQFYASSEKPTDAGVYQMIVTYPGTNANAPEVDTHTFEIDERPLNIIIHDVEKWIGDKDPEFTWEFANDTDLVAGDEVEINLGRINKSEELGTYTINHTVKDVLDNLNYNINSQDGTLTIKKRVIEITVDNASKVYGETDPTWTYIANADNAPFLEGYPVEFLFAREEGENAGQYTISGTATYDEGIYDVTINNGTFTINQKEITVKVDDLNKVYGETDPKLTVTVNGLIEADKDFDIIKSISRVEGENVGSYDINVLIKPLMNYVLVGFTGGKLTINKKELTNSDVNVDIANVTFNGTAQTPEVEVTFENKELVEGTDYTVTYTNNTNAGTATVTITFQGNYSGTITDTFTIAKKDVTVTVNNETITYGDTLPIYSATVDGLVGTDTLDITYACNTNGTVGTYDIVATVADHANYNVKTNTNGTLTINAKTLTNNDVEVNVADVTYNGKVQTPEVKVTLGNKELVEGTDYTVTYTNNTNAGTAKVTITFKGNYSGTATETFTINKANVTIKVNDANKFLYGTDPVLTGTVTGLVNANDLGTITYGREAGETVGTYKMTANYTANANYNVTVTGTFTIKALTETEDYIFGIEEKTTVESMIQTLKASGKLLYFVDATGKAVTTGTVGTGMKFQVAIGGNLYTRTVVIMGDVDGDGSVRPMDFKVIKNQIMGETDKELTGAFKIAANLYEDKYINAVDYTAIRNHIMAIGDDELVKDLIVQNDYEETEKFPISFNK